MDVDTSIEVSDVSLSDFPESRKGTRKRKRHVAPLKFEEDPLDATFYSPDRPRAVPNPIGAPAVDVLGQTNSWISLDEFGQVTTNNRQLPRRRPVSSRGRDDVITCSRADCAHPLHVHNRDAAKRQFNISDSDSDLLISVDDNRSQSKIVTKNVTHSKNSNVDDNILSPSSSSLIEEKGNHVHSSRSKDSDSGIGKTQAGSSKPSARVRSEHLNHIDHVTACKTPDISSETDLTAPNREVRDLGTPSPISELQSPSFQRVGFSQCKPGKSVKRTRQIECPDSHPEPVYVEKENLRRRVVFESPRTPLNVSMANKGPLNVLETPDSGSSKILVENTPEHLVGLRMVTRRLRKVLQQTVPDSLNF